MRVNLLPEQYRKKSFSFTRVVSLLIPLLFLLILVGLYVGANNQLRVMRQEIQLLEIDHETLEMTLFQARRFEQELQELEEYFTSFYAFHSALNWTDLLMELGYLVTDGIQLTEFRISSDDTVVFSGQVKNYGLITYLTYQIDASPYFVGSELKTTAMDRREEKMEFWIEGLLRRGENL